jgi:hypothetical protein
VVGVECRFGESGSLISGSGSFLMLLLSLSMALQSVLFSICYAICVIRDAIFD